MCACVVRAQTESVCVCSKSTGRERVCVVRIQAEQERVCGKSACREVASRTKPTQVFATSISTQACSKDMLSCSKDLLL